MQNVEGAQAATEHLLRSGRRRVVALGAHPGEVIGSAGLRLAGYRRALDDAGLPFDEDLVVSVGPWHRRDGSVAMRDFLGRGVAFDAVAAFNDTLALGAMRALQDHGLSIPGDVAITGFDNIDETQFSMPALTTIDPGREEIAETAIDLLLERIAGRVDDAPREIAVPFRLIERES
jgi:DNA-binding LacI/PurR family transcriptional regulator